MLTANSSSSGGLSPLLGRLATLRRQLRCALPSSGRQLLYDSWQAALAKDAVRCFHDGRSTQDSMHKPASISNTSCCCFVLSLQFPSPYEARPADTEDFKGADSGVFVPPAQRAVPPVTVGVAIVKPVNTLVGPALNATYAAAPTAVNFTGQSSTETATLPPATAAGDNKPYPGGAAPTNSIVLPDDRARQGAIAAQPPPASQPTTVVPTLVPQEPPNQPPAAPNTSTPTNPQGHTRPVSIHQRTPVHKPLPTFEPSPPLRPPGSPSMQPGAGAESHGGPAAHNKADGAAKQVDPSKQVVISKNTGSRRLLKG